MNAPALHLTPDMGELHVANALLGDRAALDAAWARDGYWFFRNVLDLHVIARIRQIYVDFLVQSGVADADDPAIRYNGGDLSAFPPRMDPLVERQVYRELHEAPEINAFFERLFGVAPFWLPFTEYRATPPVKDRTRSRFDFIHEDGVYNDGLPFLICWVPLAEIDADTGGLALVEGAHHGPCLHRQQGMAIPGIELSDVPVGQWRRTVYQPGDVLLMDRRTPHSGLSNVSDRFRLSMDTRILPSGPDTPIVGPLVSVASDRLTINDGNCEHVVAVDERSFVRGLMGDQMAAADIPVRYAPGDWVIAAIEDGRVVNMRPRH